jgi:hypothetical protein
MRKVKENKPDEGGRFLIPTPPMSRELQVFSGGFIAVIRGASAIGAAVADGWAAEVAGDDSEASGESVSFAEPFVSGRGGLTRFGFVIGIADFATVLEAIALARARW